MTFAIRLMTESDIDSVYAIEQDIHVAPWSNDILSACVRVGYNCYVVEIKEDNQPKLLGAYIMWRCTDSVCHILNFGIAKPLQSKGYGRKILQRIMSALKKEGMKYVVLEVRPSNQTALHLYCSMGFEQEHIKQAYYTDEHGVEDAIFLRKKL